MDTLLNIIITLLSVVAISTAQAATEGTLPAAAQWQSTLSINDAIIAGHGPEGAGWRAPAVDEVSFEEALRNSQCWWSQGIPNHKH